LISGLSVLALFFFLSGIFLCKFPSPWEFFLLASFIGGGAPTKTCRAPHFFRGGFFWRCLLSVFLSPVALLLFYSFLMYLIHSLFLPNCTPARVAQTAPPVPIQATSHGKSRLPFFFPVRSFPPLRLKFISNQDFLSRVAVFPFRPAREFTFTLWFLLPRPPLLPANPTDLDLFTPGPGHHHKKAEQAFPKSHNSNSPSIRWFATLLFYTHPA